MHKPLSLGTDAYKFAFLAALGEEKGRVLTERLKNPARSQARVCFHTIKAQSMLEQENFSATVQSDVSDGAVLVVENIDLNWIAILGVTFNIDPAFFAEHAVNPQGPSPTNAVFGKWSADHRKPICRHMQPQSVDDLLTAEHESWHVDGVVEFDSLQQQPSVGEANSLPRVIAYERQNGWQVTTRISYSLLTPKLYLMLVDAPVIHFPSRAPVSKIDQRPQLRVPLGLNRGGLILPYPLDGAAPSIFGCLYHFFSHPWHFHVLFAKEPDAEMHLSPETIFHLIASSTWETNLRILERRIKQISFEEIRRPSVRTMDLLHDQRRDLSFILEQVVMSLKWMPPRVRSELETVKDKLPAAKYIGFPDIVQTEVVDRASRLDKFLIDTFNLLLSTISVLEAESTRKQTSRGQILTKLAFVYGPLSFVTGLFGMNVKEINGSPLSIWVTFIVLIVVGCCTGAGLAFHKIWRIARMAGSESPRNVSAQNSWR